MCIKSSAFRRGGLVPKNQKSSILNFFVSPRAKGSGRIHENYEITDFGFSGGVRCITSKICDPARMSSPTPSAWLMILAETL